MSTERLIEAIEKWAEAQREHDNIYRKASSESLAHSRFSEGRNFIDVQMSDLIESPTAMKELKTFMKGLSKKVLPFVIEGDWDEALKCYIAGVDEFMEQHKEKDTSNNEAHYS